MITDSLRLTTSLSIVSCSPVRVSANGGCPSLVTAARYSVVHMVYSQLSELGSSRDSFRRRRSKPCSIQTVGHHSG